MTGVMPAGFARVHRLTSRSEFDEVYRTGQLLQNEYLRIYVLLRESEAVSRLGLSVPKRLGKAAVRNRLKRWIREWFRVHKGAWAPLDLVVQPKVAALTLEPPALVECLQDLMATLPRTERS
jgi:ribonuclease P protein component